MTYFKIKNFEQFQHYKDRAPIWIKLYNALLDDYEFGCLSDASKAHLMLIWLLASRHKNRLPYDTRWVAQRISATEEVDLKELLSAGFIEMVQGASIVGPMSEQDACLEKRREEKNREEKDYDSSYEESTSVDDYPQDEEPEAPPEDPDKDRFVALAKSVVEARASMFGAERWTFQIGNQINNGERSWAYGVQFLETILRTYIAAKEDMIWRLWRSPPGSRMSQNTNEAVAIKQHEEIKRQESEQA